MDWFLYDIGLRHERVNKHLKQASQTDKHKGRQTKTYYLRQRNTTIKWLANNKILIFNLNKRYEILPHTTFT